MVNKCCVPKCRGNYAGGEKVSVFRFPSDERLKMKWTRSIPRANFTPSTYSTVCIKHFVTEDVLWETSMFDEKTGKLVTVKLPAPRLREGAVPSVFPECPSYLSTSVKTRLEPEEKRRKKEMEQLEKCIKDSIEERRLYQETRSFKTLDECFEKLQKFVCLGDFSIIMKTDKLLLCHIIADPFPVMKACVVIEHDLMVNVFLDHAELKKVGNFIFPMHVKDTNTINDVLAGLNLLISDKPVPNSCMADKLRVILQLLVSLQASDEFVDTVNFLTEQIKLMMSNKHSYRYRSETFVFCSIFFTISPHAYKFVRSSGMFQLPHPTTIRQVCAGYNLSPQLDLTHNLAYAKTVFSTLKSHERHVVLMMDEIHVKPYVDYKGGNIVGISQNSPCVAKTAYVFMVSSLMSSFKEVVYILPVSKFSADELFVVTKNIILALEGIGYRIVSLVSDNNAINRRAVSKFSLPNKLSIVYPNPYDKSRPLFFLFDSVHILKCIRNNWLNQGNGQQFLYPNFDDACKPKATASFNSIRELYFLECGDIVRYGHSLTIKALYPSNLERQNVKLALQVFNENVVNALTFLGSSKRLQHSLETAAFVKIVTDWWKVVNVKTPFKGLRLRDALQKPLTLGCEGVKLLESVFEWVDRWGESGCGNLSHETRTAFMHTTHALIELASYCITELGMEYMLPGKVQTDALEGRFGLYRRLSGSNYHVSIRQLYESETKLRLQTCLPLQLKSQACERIVIDSVDVDDDVMDMDGSESGSFIHFNIFVEPHDIDDVSSYVPVLSYIAGYCVRSYLKKVNCSSCKELFAKDCMLEDNHNDDFIKCLSRGGLFLPHEISLNAVLFCFVVLNKIVSGPLEEKFLREDDQRTVLFSVSMNALILSDFFSDEDCTNGHPMSSGIKKIVYVACNIFLKNYSRKLSDACSRPGCSRKIVTLMK